MVPSDMGAVGFSLGKPEQKTRRGICECQPQPKQLATLATTLKELIHYRVMSYID